MTDVSPATVLWNSVQVPIDNDPAYSGQPLAVPTPNASLRGTSSVIEMDRWFSIGEAWAHIVSRFLPANPKVLDLGCGCGKLARFLALNPQIRYYGLDVFLPSIAWCKRAFAPITGDRFHFAHFDAKAPGYNPHGAIDPARYAFPFPASELDVVVCASLFTHLAEKVCLHYLQEIRRVLKPGGRAIISIHTEPAPGEAYSHTEARTDVDLDYFSRLAYSAGLRKLQTIGVVYAQTVIVFES